MNMVFIWCTNAECVLGGVENGGVWGKAFPSTEIFPFVGWVFVLVYIPGMWSITTAIYSPEHILSSMPYDVNNF